MDWIVKKHCMMIDKDIKVKKKDIILGITIIIIGLILMFVMKLYNNSQGDEVIIKVDGKIYGKYSLDKNQEIEIDTEYGHNTVCIENRKAYMKEADCPDGYCKHQGHISKGNQTIVCLPHKLVVEIKVNDKSSGDNAKLGNNNVSKDNDSEDELIPDAIVK